MTSSGNGSGPRRTPSSPTAPPAGVGRAGDLGGRHGARRAAGALIRGHAVADRALGAAGGRRRRARIAGAAGRGGAGVAVGLARAAAPGVAAAGGGDEGREEEMPGVCHRRMVSGKLAAARPLAAAQDRGAGRRSERSRCHHCRVGPQVSFEAGPVGPSSSRHTPIRSLMSGLSSSPWRSGRRAHTRACSV